MLEFLKTTLAGDVVPVVLSRRKLPNGISEVELRWRRGINSKFSQIKVAYNVSPEDYLECVKLFSAAARRQGVDLAVIQRNEAGDENTSK